MASWIHVFHIVNMKRETRLTAETHLPAGRQGERRGKRFLSGPALGGLNEPSRFRGEPACAKPRLQKPCGGQALRRRQVGGEMQTISCSR